MTWLENKYVNLISSRLNRFKRKSGTLWNFRCPFCHDSEKNEHKARGYFFEKQNSISFFCHNCGLSYRFETFLHHIDLKLYNEYRIEKLKNEKAHKELNPDFKTTVHFDTSVATNALYSLRKISQLSHDHPAKEYIVRRQIPNEYHAVLRWCPRFYDWTNTLIPEKFSKSALKKDEGRIIIPFFNEHNHFFAYQGRSINENTGLRYITIVLNASEPLLFGLNTIKLEGTRQVKVVEGPFDSMFLDNCIAMGGSSFAPLTSKLPIDKIILIFDNEPRSKETKDKIKHAIQNGFSVCIWPSNVEQKDVNGMVLGGYDPSHIEWIIDHNVHNGLGALAKLNQWSRQ